MSSEEDSALEGMITHFRVFELQDLLSWMGWGKYGKKMELVKRCLYLVRNEKSPQLVSKIKSLYAALRATGRGLPDFATASSTIPVPGIRAGGTSARGTNAVASSTSAGTSAIGPAALGARTGRPASSVTSSSTDTGMPNNGIRSAPPLRTLNQPQVSSQPVRQPCVRRMQQVLVVPVPPVVIIPTIIKPKELHLLRPYPITLIRPTILVNQDPGNVQQSTFTFHVTPNQANQLLETSRLVHSTEGMKREYIKRQIMLRFCALDYLKPEQEDLFLPDLSVFVNDKPIPLVDVIPGFPNSNCRCMNCIHKISKPINITHATMFSQTVPALNVVNISWNSKYDFKKYAVSAYIVERRSTEELLSRLLNNGSRPASFTKNRIREIMKKTDDDDVSALTSLPVSLACPIGKKRMKYPCRSITCQHLQCFDAEYFLQMQERNEKFKLICPICKSALKLEDLRIDQYFGAIIKELQRDVGDDIEIHPDGSWEPVAKNKNKGGNPQEVDADSGVDDMASLVERTICLDLDSTVEVDEIEDAPGMGKKFNQVNGSGAPTVQSRADQGSRIEFIDLTT